jgi:lipopolysaccharide transport system ATP-binding protein
MGKEEIKRKFDEIVAFAEVEKFLDTPVKRYSSGMYVRLAFAVAAHLEPEILIVDEVLAVGDAQFQKKCLGKMEDVGKDGRTVVFVSHNMAAINALCEKVFFLQQGFLVAQGSCSEVITHYLKQQDNELLQESIMNLQSHPGRQSDCQIILQRAEIFCAEERTTNFMMGANLKIVVHFESSIKVTNPRFGIAIEDITGQRVVIFSPSQQAPTLFPESISQGTVICDIPSLPLLPGLYYISLIFANSVKDLDRIERAIQFSVESSDVFGTGYAPSSGHGIFYASADWKFNYHSYQNIHA